VKAGTISCGRVFALPCMHAVRHDGTERKTLMDILAHPNPALKQTAQVVDPTTDRSLPRLISDMAKAMYDAPGVGLAATQVGVQKRVVVFDLDDGIVALCNPTIVSRSSEVELDDEGCLSLPGITVPVERACEVVCEALDVAGRPVRIEGTGLLSRVLQHETDHLDGVLIIDRATAEDRKDALRRYRELHSG
jgi:peptide deformylase